MSTSSYNNSSAVNGLPVTQQLVTTNNSLVSRAAHIEMGNAMLPRSKRTQVGYTHVILEDSEKPSPHIANHGDVAFVILDTNGDIITDGRRGPATFDSPNPSVSTIVSGLPMYASVKAAGVIGAGPGQHNSGRVAVSVVVNGAIAVRNTGDRGIARGDTVYIMMPSCDHNRHNTPTGQSDDSKWDGNARIAIYSGRSIQAMGVGVQAPTQGADFPVDTHVIHAINALNRVPTLDCARAVVKLCKDTEQVRAMYAELEAHVNANAAGLAANPTRYDAVIAFKAHTMRTFWYAQHRLGTALESAAPTQRVQILVGRG